MAQVLGITFLRHGNAAPAIEFPNGTMQDDWLRPLTNLGVNQARTTRDLQRIKSLKFDVLFTSRAHRARSTGEIVTRKDGFIIIPELGIEAADADPEGATISEVFEALKYAELQKYLQHPGAREPLLAYGERAGATILSRSEIRNRLETGAERTEVLCAGHAAISPIIAFAMCGGDGPGKELLGYNMPEAGAFRLEFVDGAVKGLEIFC